MAENGQNSSASSPAVRERRKPRYSANLSVMVFTRGLNHFMAEKTANISLGGLFVCTDHNAEVGEKLHIRIMMSDLDAYFDVKSEVVWVCPKGSGHPQGLGLRFCDLNEDQQAVISRFLKNYINVNE